VFIAMASAAQQEDHQSSGWPSAQAYGLALACLILGLAAGYFLRGTAPAAAAPTGQQTAASAPATGMGDPVAATQVTPEQMRHMADEQAKSLLADLARNPKDVAMLIKVGNTYYDAQQYKDAITYYQRALDLQPSNADVRTDMGTAYWYLGDADTAIREFDRSLQYNPTHPGTLLNLGVVKWQGKMDINGALAAWQKLLDTNPNFGERAQVEQLIARARQHANIKPGTKTDKPARM
jgi:cytochrome c-type biogenesis protein CcmH/NrfG